jgi:hypothetical protein
MIPVSIQRKRLIFFHPPGEVQTICETQKAYGISENGTLEQPDSQTGNAELFHNIGNPFLHGKRIMTLA